MAYTEVQIINALPEIIVAIDNGHIQVIDGADEVLGDEGKADVAIITVGDKQYTLQMAFNENNPLRTVYHINEHWIGSTSPQGIVDGQNDGVSANEVGTIADWCNNNTE